MKKILFFILFFGFFSLGITFYFSEFKPEETLVIATEKFKPMSYQEQMNLERRKQQEIILAGLVSRCKKFGWDDAGDIASCIQQEAYRDLQLEKQKYQIKALEEKIKFAKNLPNNNSPQYIEEEPLFLYFLNAYADTKSKESISKMKRDIDMLKSKSTYSGSSAEAALKSLYRDGE